MKSSWLAAAKSAGMKHFVTCLIGVRCSISKLARLCIDFRIRANADETRKPGTFVCDFANSLTSTLSDENGLSRIMPAILGSLSPCNSAVTEPMDLPQSPTVDTLR